MVSTETTYRFDRRSTERIFKTVIDSERAADPFLGRPPRTQEHVAERWFRLDDILKNNGTPTNVTWLHYSAKSAGLVPDADQPTDPVLKSVVDNFHKSFGINGEIGTAKPVAIADGSIVYQVWQNPGRAIYKGTIPTSDWQAGTVKDILTPVFDNYPVNVSVPVIDNYMEMNTSLPTGATVRYYFNLDINQFELLDSPVCPT